MAGGCARVSISGGGVFATFGNQHEASRDDAQEFSIKPGEKLKGDLSNASIRVQTGGASLKKSSIKARFTTFGETAAEASANLDKCKLRVERADDGVTIAIDADDLEFKSGVVVIRRSPNVQLEVTIPDGVALALSTASGSISAKGPFAASKVSSKYGSIELSYVDGDAVAFSGSGHVQISNIDGAKTIDAKSAYGAVSIHDASGEKLKAESSSGSIEINDAKAASIDARTSYGSIRIARVEGELRAKSGSGHIELIKSTFKDASIETSYGSISASEISGDLEATSSSGKVNINDFKGGIRAKSGYGSVSLDGVIAGGLSASSTSGSVTVHARDGSTMTERWDVESGYGNLVLELPAAFYCDLNAATSYGSIDCDFSVLTKGGKNKKNSTLKGTLNPEAKPSEGAALHALKLTTASGNIQIHRR